MTKRSRRTVRRVGKSRKSERRSRKSRKYVRRSGRRRSAKKGKVGGSASTARPEWAERVTNLKKKHKTKTDAEIVAALEETGGHAGLARKILDPKLATPLADAVLSRSRVTSKDLMWPDGDPYSLH
jgi:hypothetical protein